MYTLQNMHVFTAWIIIFVCCLPEENHLTRGGRGGEGSGVSDNLPLDMSMNQLGRALEREI